MFRSLLKVAQLLRSWAWLRARVSWPHQKPSFLNTELLVAIH